MTVMPSPPPDRTKFVDPPIVELVVSLFHLPILELKAQHIGLYWDCIRDRFPICEQQLLVTSPSDLQPFIEAPGEILPLPRFWFRSDKHSTLIQIQRNAFMLNWRRTPGAGDYPHYESVVDDFWKELQRYASFIQDTVGGKLDVIHRCELNYINVIPTNQYFPDVTRVGAVLPSLSGLETLATGDRRLAGMNAAVTYRLGPNLLADMLLRLGRRADTGDDALVLELKAHGAPDDLSMQSAREWYDEAHDVTYKLFLDATAKELQEKIWKLR
jgi:uncharacterized protein (TIGR04255 family)